jgi:inward rectifier potassium channel
MTSGPRRSPRRESDADLGFGSVVARESRRRLLNRDGSFNVRREGLSIWESVPLYHVLLTLSWPRFLALLTAGFLAANTLFASAFALCGPGALAGIDATPSAKRFADEFFFSVHTLSTIGYGNVVPRSFAANVVVTFESMVGLLALALIAGIVFARFSRPVAQIIFSNRAVIAPYGDGEALMFRVANRRSSQLVDLHAQVLLARRTGDAVTADREFIPLPLQRDRVNFFPLTWTLVHAIDDSSPFRDVTSEQLVARDAEVLILLSAFDETSSQTVHTRSSYTWGEIVFGATFRSPFNPPGEDGVVSVDIKRIHEYERLDRVGD